MGEDISTTDHIEKHLRLWIEGDPETVLHRTLSQTDAPVLRASEDWIYGTLDGRDKQALTFDVFEQASNGPVEKRKEGAIRRSLTDIYIDSYVTPFDARIVWGFRGKNHFESTKLLAGLNFPFAQLVLQQTGIADNLRNTANFGQHKRIVTDRQDAAAQFRESYAHLASAIDLTIEDPRKWHVANSKITSIAQRLRATGALKPRRTSSSYRDLLFRASEALEAATQTIASDHSSGDSRIVELNRLARLPEDSSSMSQPELRHLYRGVQNASTPKSQPPSQGTSSWWNTHVTLVILGSALIGLTTYFSLPELFELGSRATIFVSGISSLIGGALIFWFHPDNFYRRHALYGLGIATVGGISYQFDFEAWSAFGGGSLELGNLPSTVAVFGGVLYSGASIIADAIFRSKRKN
jgi:hypothetical protein